MRKERYGEKKSTNRHKKSKSAKKQSGQGALFPKEHGQGIRLGRRSILLLKGRSVWIVSLVYLCVLYGGLVWALEVCHALGMDQRGSRWRG